MKGNLVFDLNRHAIILIAGLLPGQLFSQKNVDYRPPSEWAWGIEDSMEYLIYTPGNLEIGKKYPIALYLHGCCGDSPHAIPHRGADPPVRMWHNFEDNTQEIPTYIISPQTTRGWSQHFESIRKVIDFLVEKRQGDPQRIYIVGFSMGGRGTFEFISKYPDYFAAAIPIGMSFRNGDFEKIKDVPIWANQGETDRHAAELPKFVRETRALNGLALDTAAAWVTGVNPRYTSFEGLGHLVQWEVTSTQDLTGWAYSKINDGNKYPNVFFESPSYREQARDGKTFAVHINASDPDGTIDKVDLYLNRQHHSTITKPPYSAKIKPAPGDNLLEVTAYDDKGKTSTATTTLVVDRAPEIHLDTLPYARAGAAYSYALPAAGNGVLSFTGSGFPAGVLLSRNGLIKGIPLEAGDFFPEITLRDEDGDEIVSRVNFSVERGRDGDVRITGAEDTDGDALEISRMVYGETPNFNRGNEPSSFVPHYSFSNIGDYYGLTFVKSDEKDSTAASETYMTFNVDQPVEVMVAYEKFDHTRQTTKPEWLNDFRKLPGEIRAQLKYFDVYSKNFPAGRITLPGGDKVKHGVTTNYFVMIRREGFDNTPEINMQKLPAGYQGTYYEEGLSSLYGHGKLKWKLKSNRLPEGLRLSDDGKVSGIAGSKDTFFFEVLVTDEKGQTSQAKMKMEIR